MTTREEIEIAAINLLAAIESNQAQTSQAVELAGDLLRNMLNKKLILKHKPEWAPVKTGVSLVALLEASNRGFFVTKEGQLLGPAGNIKSCQYKNGYKQFQFSYFGKNRNLKVHRLQALQKYGYEAMNKEGIVVRHLNSKKDDNSWDNIAIGSQADNLLDVPTLERIEQGRVAGKVSAQKTRKIPELMYKEITNFYFEQGYSKTFTCRHFSKILGCHPSAVQKFLDGVTYKKLGK